MAMDADAIGIDELSDAVVGDWPSLKRARSCPEAVADVMNILEKRVISRCLDEHMVTEHVLRNLWASVAKRCR